MILILLRIVFMFSIARASVLRALAGSVAGTLLLAGCSALTGTGGGGDDRVVAAFYPLAWVTGRVAGGGYEVTNLTQPGGEPHDLELSIKETADVEQAALMVFEHGFQTAVDAAVEQNAEGAVLDVTDVVDLRPFADHSGEDHAADDGHDHGDLDPHFWLDPLLMADVADAVADELGDLDPEHADEYAANAADVRDDLTALDREYADGLADCALDTVVVNHDAFGYLARYGLHLETDRRPHPRCGADPGRPGAPAGPGAHRRHHHRLRRVARQPQGGRLAGERPRREGGGPRPDRGTERPDRRRGLPVADAPESGTAAGGEPVPDPMTTSGTDPVLTVDDAAVAIAGRPVLRAIDLRSAGATSSR